MWCLEKEKLSEDLLPDHRDTGLDAKVSYLL